MTSKTTYIILTGVIICSLLSNIRLWNLYKQQPVRMEALFRTMDHLTEIEFMHTFSKELTVSRKMHEQHDLSDAAVYMGSDKNTLLSVRDIISHPKLLLKL